MLWWTLRRLKSKNPDTRKQAASELGEIGDVRAIQPLIDTLGDEHWERTDFQKSLESLSHDYVDKRDLYNAVYPVREAAVQALRKMGTASVEPLIAALKEGKDASKPCAMRRRCYSERSGTSEPSSR